MEIRNSEVGLLRFPITNIPGAVQAFCIRTACDWGTQPLELKDGLAKVDFLLDDPGSRLFHKLLF